MGFLFCSAQSPRRSTKKAEADDEVQSNNTIEMARQVAAIVMEGLENSGRLLSLADVDSEDYGSLDAGADFPPKIRNKILNAEYVNMAEMLSPSENMESAFEFKDVKGGNTFKMVSQPSKRVIYNIEQWTYAFTVYASVLCQNMEIKLPWGQVHWDLYFSLATPGQTDYGQKQSFRSKKPPIILPKANVSL